MTAKKDLKRLVRARAKTTGESYAAALRHFRQEAAEVGPMADAREPVEPTNPADRAAPALRRIERPGLGFALRIPEHWVEGPVDPFSSPHLVAQFRRPPSPADAPAGTETCLVYRRDFSAATRLAFRAGGLLRRALPVMAAARLHRLWLMRRGYVDVRIREATVAGKPGARIDYSRTYPGRGRWSGRDYFVEVGDHGFSLALGTWAPERDATLFDTLAAGFELIGPGAAPTSAVAHAAAPPPEGPAAGRRRLRIDRQTRRRFAACQPNVRRAVLAAHEAASERGDRAIQPEHLLWGIAVTARGGPGALADLGVSWQAVGAAVEAALAARPGAVSDGSHRPSRDRLRVALDLWALLSLAEEEARVAGRAQVGVGELVLAILRRGEGPAHEALASLGVRLDTYRAAVARYFTA